MTATDTQVTGRSDLVATMRRGAHRIRNVFPFRGVVLPWLIVRVIVVPILVVKTDPRVSIVPGQLLAMDGGWFRSIALDWYDRHDGVGGSAEYPFFPLFPGAGGVLMRAGVPSTIALAGLAWIAALLAMAGARLLAARHLGEGAARLTPWVIALAPGGLSLILGYSDAFYLAALIWAVLAVDQRCWWLAGVLAGLATASRPNGVIACVAVVTIALGLRAGRRQLVVLVVPSIAFLAAWTAYLWSTTGDPLLFWTAKSQWLETTLVEFVTHPLHQSLTVFHVVWLMAFLVPYLLRVRQQPPAWSVVVVLGVMPALALGVVGVARYAILAFPLPIIAAQALSERPRWVQVVAITTMALALMLFSRLVVTQSWVP